MLKGITLKHRMILGGIAAVFIPFLIAGIIIYILLSRSLLELTREKLVLITKDLSGVVSAVLTQEIKLASAVAADPDIIAAVKTDDLRHAQARLEATYRSVGKGLFTMLVADKDGIIRADALFPRQIGLNVSDRDYFRRAREGMTSVAGPLPAKGVTTPGEPVVIVAVPILENNEFRGVVGMAVDMDVFVSVISQEKLGKTGYACIINPDGLVLVHPNRDNILKMRLVGQPGTEGLKGLIREKKAGTAFYSYQGMEMIAGIATVPLTDWIVLFTQAKDEVMAPVNRILYAIFVSGMVFLVITVSLIVIYFSGISSPIQKMIEAMKQVTQNSAEIIFQIGLDRRIIFANPAFERITGLKPESIVGTEPDLTNFSNTPPEVVWDSLKDGTPWSGRLALKGSGPDETILDVMLMPFRDGRGAIQGYIEIGRDVTAELMYEKRLEQAQKLEAIGTLAGGIAHDFNNILSGVFGYAELCLMTMPKAEPPTQTETYVREILKAAERARDLVSQILTFSRRTEVELKALLPKLILKEALKLLRPSIPATIDIKAKLVSDAAIMAEPTQIHQIVMNLFTNAAYAIGDKVGTIEIDLEDFMVDDEFVKSHPGVKRGPHVILRISDTGSGMDAQTLSHIFEPFFTTKPQGKGTGLGLSAVHGIVRKLGGIINVYSQVGKGTTFNIIIPGTEPKASELSESDYVILGGTERVAVIDDEPAVTATMQTILASLGYTVTGFTDGMEALKEIERSPDNFDLIITDYSMPRITGLEIAKNLREKGIHIPIILLSGYFGGNLEGAVKEAGISELITKPINTYGLTGAIRRALSKG